MPMRLSGPFGLYCLYKKTKKRELRSLVKAAKELYNANDIELLLLTMDTTKEEVLEGQTIKIVNILEWLLLDSFNTF